VCNGYVLLGSTVGLKEARREGRLSTAALDPPHQNRVILQPLKVMAFEENGDKNHIEITNKMRPYSRIYYSIVS
jgi:hypothetical protein